MSKKDMIELDGTVTTALPGAKFIVDTKVGDNDYQINCTISGRLRKNFIRIMEGDRVTLQVSPYDLTNGIITWRK